MKKQIRTNRKLIVVLSAIILVIATAASVKYPTPAPTGYSGAATNNCRSCHSGNTLNNAGGSVTITGLPANYSAGAAYPISVVITHSAANRKKFGFSLKVVNSAGTVVGTLSKTNTYVTTGSSELLSNNPPAVTATNTYTFANLTWTAPAAPGTNDQTVKFYICGNACDGNGGTSGDFVYTNLYSIPLTTTGIVELPKSMKEFKIISNPSHDNITVRYNVVAATNVKFVLFDANGKTIITQNAGKVSSGENQTRINVQGVPNGVYLLKIETNQASFTSKVVIN